MREFCENCGGRLSRLEAEVGGHLNFCSERCFTLALTRTVRRRIEDRLRKSEEAVFKAAELLGIPWEF